MAITYTSSPRNTLGCLGDSLTYNGTLGTRAHEFFPYVLANLLTTSAVPPYKCKARNFGKSGDSSCMLFGAGRMSLVNFFEIPDIGVIYIGTNDTNAGHFGTVQASPAPTTTTIAVTAGIGVTMPVGSYILINGFSTKVVGQNVDNLTFVANANIGTPTTGQTVTPDTQTNIVQLVAAFNAIGCSKVVVVGQPYLNYSANGDTTTSQQAAAQTLRGLQKAAAAAAGVPYVDLYTFCQQRILNGIDTQGSFSYHVFDQNIHPSPYGSTVWAQAIFNVITAQPGWLPPVNPPS